MKRGDTELKKKKKKLQSRRPYKRYTAKIGDILEYKALEGDVNAKTVLAAMRNLKENDDKN